MWSASREYYQRRLGRASEPAYRVLPPPPAMPKKADPAENAEPAKTASWGAYSPCALYK